MRDPNATPFSSGYMMHLYCDQLECQRLWKEPEVVTADGPRSYYQARKNAIALGWVLHRDDTATCPACSNRNNQP